MKMSPVLVDGRSKVPLHDRGLPILCVGLGAGGLYALAAIGLVLVYREGVVNVAQAAMGMVGAYDGGPETGQ